MPLREVKLPYYRLAPTGDVAERVVELFIPQQFFLATTTVTPGVTMTAFLSTLSPMDKSRVLDAGYGSYLLTGPMLNGTPEGTLGFYFAKPKSSSSLSSLTPYKEETIWQDYDWPTVIYSLYAVQGEMETERESYQYNQSNGGNDYNLWHFKPVFLDRYRIINGRRLSTEVIVRDYNSPTPFTDVIVEPPVTSVVSYSYLDIRETIDCLHPDIFIPEMFKGGRLISGFGTKGKTEHPDGTGQFFPATNMQDWESHIFRADYSSSNGLYQLRTYEALPPDSVTNLV
jgi:hypothetical protein